MNLAPVRGDVAPPTKIETTGGPTAWRAVAAGFQSTCAIAGDGRLLCWGRNDFGQLGLGTTADAGTPTPIDSLLDDWTLVAMGGGQQTGQHTCAVSASAGLHCWGSNVNCQLADPALGSSASPLPVALPDVTALALGSYHSCAVSAGDLYCWGSNSFGSLGDPAVIVPDGQCIATPRLGSALQGGWSELGASEIITCGLHEGEVYCWGHTRNGNGVAGGVWEPGRTAFTLVAEGAEHLAVSSNQSIDLTGGTILDLEGGCYLAAGAIRCWGDNRFGQLGQGAPAETAVPLEIAGGRTWRQLATGARHSCGVDDAGQLACWGSTLAAAVDGTRGGTADTPCGQFPCDLGAPQDIRASQGIAIGTNHTCSIDNGEVICWGDNRFQQLGAAGPSGAPATISGTFSELFDLHGNQSCARTATDITCWGNSTDPSPVAELVSPTTIAGAGILSPGFPGFGCFLENDGTLFCAGDNLLGQYGNGNGAACAAGACPQCGNAVCDGGETTASCPNDCGTTFSRLRNYSALSLGWDIDNTGAPNCGITGGAVECWGKNPGAMITQAIDETTQQVVTYAFEPQPIPNLAGCTAISVGHRHACALCNDDILCWGDHRHGEVGSGPQTGTPVLEPRPIDLALAPGDRWVQLTSGVGFSCARSEAGRGYCWGGNQHGALGLGAAASTIPLLVRTE